MQNFSALVFQGTLTSFCISDSFVILHALSALFDVGVDGMENEIGENQVGDDDEWLH